MPGRSRVFPRRARLIDTLSGSMFKSAVIARKHMQPWERRLNKDVNGMALFSLLAVLTCADISLTLHCIAIDGFYEANPIAAFLMGVSVPFFIAVKYAGILSPVIIIVIMLRDKEAFIKAMTISSVLTAIVVTWNVVMLVVHG